MIRDLKEKHGITIKVPQQFNLVPINMWVHPIHNNIDASIGCVTNLKDLAKMGVKMECLSANEYTRK